MAFWGELARRVAYLWRRRRFQSELDEEIRLHIEFRAEELEQCGMPRAEAVCAARREFGPPARAAEDTRAAWQFGWLEDLVSDLRYAMRALRRNPAFAVTAVVCLALGIGANITMFGITTSFLFSRPSCSDPATLVGVRVGGNSHAEMPDYRFYVDARIFEGLAGINVEREVNWRNGEDNARLFAARVTSNFFKVTGIPVALGRGIAPGETGTVVVSSRFWMNRLAAAGDVLGRTLILDGRAYAVAGVLPAGHQTVIGFGLAPDLYMPVIQEDEILQMYGRLGVGTTVQVAREKLRSASAELDRTDPKEGWKRADDIIVAPANSLDGVGPGKNPIAAFFALVMIVVGLD